MIILPLSKLPLYSSGRIHGIDQDCPQNERRRLFDLGLVEGTPISPRLRSPGGDPTAYEVRGTLIALREEQAAAIQVAPDE